MAFHSYTCLLYTSLLYAQGSNIWRNPELQQNGECGKPIYWGNEAEIKAEALKIAKEADVIVCAMGESAEMSGERGSRTNLEMPDGQRELLAELLKTDKSVAVSYTHLMSRRCWLLEESSF